MSYHLLIRLFAVLVLAVGCSKSAEPPSLSSPVPMPEVEACRNSNLTFANVTPQSTRDLVNCLSGNRHVLQSYENFLNSVPDKDLEKILAVYNKYVYAPIDVGPTGNRGRRVNKLLTLLDRMRADGVLQDFYKHFGHLVKNGVLQSALPIAGRFFGSPQSFSEKEKRASIDAVKMMRTYAVDLMKRDQLTPLVLMGDRVFNSGLARAMAYLVSQPATNEQWNSDQYVDALTKVMSDAIDSGDLKSVFVYSSDLGILQAPLKISTFQTTSLGGLVNYLAKDARTNSGGQVNRFLEAIRYSDQKLVCYNGARVIPNVLEMIMTENSKIAVGQQQNFFLVKLPLLLGLTAETCAYPPRFVQSAQILFDMAVQGYALELSAGIDFLKASDRKEVLRLALSSPLFAQAAPIIEQAEQRHLIGLGLKLLNENLTIQDSQLISKLMRQWSVENVGRKELDRYLLPNKLSLQSLTAKISAVGMVKDLYGLEDALSAESLRSVAAADWYSELKSLQAHVSQDSEGGLSVYDRVAQFYKKALQEVTPQLKIFARAMTAEFSDAESGIGQFLHMAAIGSQYSQENPLQKVFIELLEDDQLMEELSPIIWNLANDPKFMEAIAFTGQLAMDGRLDVIIQFFQQALKASNDSSLGLNEFRATSLVVSSTEAVRLATDVSARPLRVGVTAPEMIDCPKVSENFFSERGLTRFLKCYGTSENDQVVLRAEETLKSNGLLQPMARFLADLFKSKWTVTALEQIEGLHRSGLLSRLNESIEVLFKGKVDVSPLANQFLKFATFENGGEQTILAADVILSGPNRQRAWNALLEGAGQQPRWIWRGQNEFTLNFHESAQLDAVIKKQHEDWSDEQVAAYGVELVGEFESRSDRWYFRDGVLPDLNVQQKRDVLHPFVERLLYTAASVRGSCHQETCQRSPGLENFVEALRKLAQLNRQKHTPHLRVSEFLRWGYKTQRVEKWYRGLEDEPVFRVMNALDQLDLLLRVANVRIATVENAGLKFKNDVYKSDNLPNAMMALKLLLRAGVGVVTVDSSLRINPDSATKAKRSLNSARNMLSNFYVLEATAQNGYMLILKELIKAFYESTPEKYQGSLDMENNDLANMDRLGDLGFFTYIGEGAARLDQMVCETTPGVRSNCLDVMTQSILDLVEKIPKTHVSKLRSLLENLLSTSATNDGRSTLDYMLDKVFERSADQNSKLALKNVSFALAIASGKTSSDLGTILEAGEVLSRSPKLMKWVTDLFVDQLFDEDSLLSRMASTFIHLPQNDFRMVENYLDKALLRNSYLSPSTESLLKVSQKMGEGQFVDLLDGFKANIESPSFVKLGANDILQKANRQYLGQNGLMAILSDNIQDAQKRRDLLGITHSLADADLWPSLLNKYFDWSRSGDQERSLNFIFENLKVGSTLVH